MIVSRAAPATPCWTLPAAAGMVVPGGRDVGCELGAGPARRQESSDCFGWSVASMMPRNWAFVFVDATTATLLIVPTLVLMKSVRI